MKKYLAIPLLLAFSYLLTSFAPGVEPVKKETARCGPGFDFYNNSGNVVTRITVQGPTSQFNYTINNPVFPYHLSDLAPSLPNGTYTFIIRFASNAANNGSIYALQMPAGTKVACETYEPPYTVPMAFTTACYIYNIMITADQAACD